MTLSSRLDRSYAVLRLPLYRRFVTAATLYSIGQWSFQTVLAWTVLEQTNSAESVSLLLMALTVPTLLFIIPAGMVADRVEPNRVMLAGQACSALTVVGVTVATASNLLSLPVAMIAIFLTGTLDTFSGVPGQVFLGRMVDRRLMASAISLSGLQYGFGRIVGGLGAGLAVKVLGPAPAIGLCAAALGASALIVSTYPLLPRLETAPGMLTLRDLRAATGWVRQSRPTLGLIGLGFAAALFTYTYLNLAPVLARDVLQSGSIGLGLLTSSGGIGVLLGALSTDVIGRRLGRGRAVVIGLGVAAVTFGGLGLSTSLPISMVLFGATTFCLAIYRVTSQLLLQHLAPARMRGRVLAIFEFSFWGVYPLGALAAGLLVDAYGAPPVVVAYAGATLLVAGGVIAVNRSLPTLDVDHEGQALVEGRAVGEGAVGVGVAEVVETG